MNTVTRFALSLTLCIAALTPAYAGQNQRAAQIGDKIRQVDLLNQILPVLMTKEQIRKILPSVDRARQAEKDLAAKELQMMKSKEAAIDAAIKEGKTGKMVPSAALLKDLSNMYVAFTAARKIMTAQSLEMVRKAMRANLNSGQIKAAANALNPKLFNPEADVSKMTEDQKLDMWIQLVMLDPLAYDLLLDLSK